MKNIEISDSIRYIGANDDELKVFENLSKNRSKVTIADDCLVSVSTVDNRIKSINKKIMRISKVRDEIG